MKVQHTATVKVPYGAKLVTLVDLVSGLADLPKDANFSITTSPRQSDQRDNTSWGGETVITVRWEEEYA